MEGLVNRNDTPEPEKELPYDEKISKPKIQLSHGPEKFICIPLQSNDIYDRSDAFHIWSCIYLSHLLRNTMLLLKRNKGLKDDSALSQSNSSDGYKFKSGRTLRGKYLTKRKEKAWWKTLKTNMHSMKEL